MGMKMTPPYADEDSYVAWSELGTSLGADQTARLLPAVKERDFQPITIDDWASLFNPLNALLTAPTQTLIGDREEIADSFAGYISGAYRANGVIFACIAARMMLFSEARFQFQQMRDGRPGDLFGTEALAVLERPEQGKTTGDLLARMLLSVDLGGNAFAVRRSRSRIVVPRPDWVSIVLGSPNEEVEDPSQDIDAEIAGFLYWPGGQTGDKVPQFLPRETVAHFAPYPDPIAKYRGMSWITPIVRELQADSAATTHKLKFFENGATPNMVVSLDPAITPDNFKRFVEMFRQQEGALNAYKTLYLGGGSSVTPVGKDFQQMDFKVTQGAGETRMASAAGIHPTILGLSEGLQGSSLNSGNFMAARRLTADKTLRPLWRNLAGSMEVLVPPPPGARLWYDDRDIPFLAEDIKDAADVQAKNSVAIRQLVDAGFDPATVVDAITAGDLKRLDHTGLVSVQLLPPGTKSGGSPPDDVARTLQLLESLTTRTEGPPDGGSSSNP